MALAARRGGGGVTAVAAAAAAAAAGSFVSVAGGGRMGLGLGVGGGVEVAQALRASGAVLLVTAAAFKTSDYMAMLREVAPELPSCAPGALRAAALPALRTVVQLGGGAAPGALPWAALVAGGGAAEAAALDAAARELDPDDVCNVQFTSGTTGAPKGVMLTHNMLLNNGFGCGVAQRLGADDAICVPVPLYHCFGSVLGVLAALTSGAAIVLPGEGFDARATLAAVEAERCTALFGVPTMFVAELGHPDFASFDLRSLRTGLMSGAPCPTALARALVDRMHLRELCIGYGMTETAPLSFMTHCTDPLERRVGSVGRVMPHVEVKIVDVATGRVVPRGVRGELCTRGYGVMRGYLDNPSATAAAIDEAGWLRTGDLAVLDADGYANIVGRIKDMIIRGGENVYPAEVEAFLLTHPSVIDAQVFGIADDVYGEEVAAWVRLRDGAPRVDADAVRAFCTGAIAHQKVPRFVDIVDAFPLTTSGKPQKYIMRETVEKRLGRRAQTTA